MLADTYIAADLREALSLGRQYPQLTFVTLEGEVVSNGGILTGGSAEGANQGLVHKKREMKELARQVAALSAKVQEKEKDREVLKDEISMVEEQLRAMRQKLHDIEIEMINCDKDLQRAGGESREIEERIALKEMEDDQLREET